MVSNEEDMDGRARVTGDEGSNVYIRSVPRPVCRCFRSQSVAANCRQGLLQNIANSRRR